MGKPREVKTYNWLAEAGFEKVRARPSYLPGFAVLDRADDRKQDNPQEPNILEDDVILFPPPKRYTVGLTITSIKKWKLRLIDPDDGGE